MSEAGGPLTIVNRSAANVYRVMVEQRHASVQGQLITCVEVGWPKEQEPHDDVLRAVRFAENCPIGETHEVVEPNPTGRRLVTGGKVAFCVQQGMPPWWP